MNNDTNMWALTINHDYDQICERRVKKTKYVEFESDAEDTVSFFNKIGVLYFHKGQNTEAKRLFCIAMAKENEINPWIDVESCLAHFATVRECLTSHEVTMANYHRSEYDEGTHIYMSALYASKSFSRELRSATLLYNIGLTCIRSKQYEEARNWFELALSNIKHLDLSQKPTASVNIVNIQHNLGHCCYRLGKTQDALRYYEASLGNVGKQCLSKLDVAIACNCIGVVKLRESLDNSSSAFGFFQISLSIYRTHVGDCNRQVGVFLKNIARAHHLRSEFDDALRTYQQALEILHKVPGVDQIDVAAILFSTGRVQYERGEADEAKQLFNRFLEIVRSSGVPKNRDIVAALKFIGKVFSETGDVENAVHFTSEALDCQRSAFGYYHPELGQTLDDAGDLCCEANDMNSAIVYFTDALIVKKMSADASLRDIISTLKRIANAHKHTKEFEEAYEAYKEAHKLQMEVSGILNPEVASLFSMMGLMQYHLKNFALSTEYYHEALHVYRECYGRNDHLDIAASLNSIGIASYKLKKYELAKGVFIESMRIRQRMLGQAHKEVAILWYNVATVCLDMGDEQQAIACYKETLRLEKQIHGDSHEEVATTLYNLGQLHESHGQLDEAINCYSEALLIIRKCMEKDQPSICKILIAIGNIHYMCANVNDMMNCLTEASRLYCRERGQQLESFSMLKITDNDFCNLSRVYPRCAPTA